MEYFSSCSREIWHKPNGLTVLSEVLPLIGWFQVRMICIAPRYRAESTCPSSRELENSATPQHTQRYPSSTCNLTPNSFVLCAPDFIDLKGGPCLVGVKTTESEKICSELFSRIPKAYAPQIWTACGILGLRKAKLMIYKCEPNRKKKNPCGRGKWVSEGQR